MMWNSYPPPLVTGYVTWQAASSPLVLYLGSPCGCDVMPFPQRINGGMAFFLPILTYPMGSMYGIFTECGLLIFMVSVSRYTIHGSYGIL